MNKPQIELRKIISFEDFQATRKPCADIGATLGEETGTPEGQKQGGLIYIDNLFIETVEPWWDDVSAQYHLLIENSTELSNDLEPLERKLYDYALASGALGDFDCIGGA